MADEDTASSGHVAVEAKVVHDLSSDHVVEEGELIPTKTPSGHVTESVKSSGHVTDDNIDKTESHELSQVSPGVTRRTGYGMAPISVGPTQLTTVGSTGGLR